jgi:hypothetical protein
MDAAAEHYLAIRDFQPDTVLETRLAEVFPDSER